MLVPTRQAVAQVANYSDAEFGEWLKRGLHGYYNLNEGRFAFKPMHTYMVQDYSIAEDLYAIFCCLESEERLTLRKGIAIALGQFANMNMESKQSIESLLQFAQMAGAVEVLPILDNKLKQDWQLVENWTQDISWTIRQTIASLESRVSREPFPESQDK